MLIEQIKTPQDLKKLPINKLEELCLEIREVIVKVVGRNGGHLSANLGSVELIVALYYVFDFPKDKIIFDVGHQAYTHKILSERYELFESIRKEGGLSGFPNIFESSYDSYCSGHAGSSISAGLGYCYARDRLNEDYYVISFVGDGALQNGVSLEGLINSSDKPEKFLVLLNDNGMSISKNTSGLYRALTALSRNKTYSKTMKRADSRIGKTFFGKILKKFKSFIKRIFSPFASLELFGLRYTGVYDGNNVKQTVKLLKDIKTTQRINLLHMKTVKGKGFEQFEHDSEKYHGIGKNFKSSVNSFSSKLGEELSKLADSNELVAISAGMLDGTGLKTLSQNHPNNVIDVGICEEHALTLASGIALGGVKPYVAVYSTFLQRAYDQIVIDMCLQNLPVCLCIDRAGLVGADGQTHQGVFDLSFLSHIPNLTILAPKDTVELSEMIKFSYKFEYPLAIRYCNGLIEDFACHDDFSLKWEKVIVNDDAKLTILAVGYRMNKLALKLSEQVDYKVNIINSRTIKPLDGETLLGINTPIITLEENVVTGGFGDAVLRFYSENGIKLKIKNLGIRDEFVSHGTIERQLEINGLTVEKIKEIAEEMLKND